MLKAYHVEYLIIKVEYPSSKRTKENFFHENNLLLLSSFKCKNNFTYLRVRNCIKTLSKTQFFSYKLTNSI